MNSASDRHDQRPSRRPGGPKRPSRRRPKKRGADPTRGPGRRVGSGDRVRLWAAPARGNSSALSTAPVATEPPDPARPDRALPTGPTDPLPAPRPTPAMAACPAGGHWPVAYIALAVQLVTTVKLSIRSIPWCLGRRLRLPDRPHRRGHDVVDDRGAAG